MHSLQLCHTGLRTGAPPLSAQVEQGCVLGHVPRQAGVPVLRVGRRGAEEDLAGVHGWVHADTDAELWVLQTLETVGHVCRQLPAPST